MDLESRIGELVERVRPADAAAAADARALHDQLAKPQGSLGRIEDVGVQLAAIAGACPPPPVERPAAIVCAGDHGVLARGVSPWPQDITALMVRTFCAGKAAINVLAGTLGAQVTVLDVGVAADLPSHPRLRSRKVARGTADLSRGPALTREQAAQALLAGAEAVEELRAGGVDLVIGGDMGIGNTTPSACMTAAFTGRRAAEVTGRGTGIDDATLRMKVELVDAALALHRPDPADPLGVLAAVGGAEHAALCGVYLGAAAARLPVLLDGVTANAAALAAAAFAPHATEYMLGGHRSVEPSASIALAALDKPPLLDLGLRLGEGTGAMLALPLVRSAAAILRDMATLAEVAPAPAEEAPSTP
ncbi:MAG TPA: nicotinate-nucleotide--dimethylbenzimidazole phosphoribosyltransferase [Solirubrobacteraceae bacterium]|nr:nicotinate-nucleotide--dimethylbenzimidazole phosphoribosyltransferase [Solirubrobacteraceae bacterium]